MSWSYTEKRDLSSTYVRVRLATHSYLRGSYQHSRIFIAVLRIVREETLPLPWVNRTKQSMTSYAFCICIRIIPLPSHSRRDVKLVCPLMGCLPWTQRETTPLLAPFFRYASDAAGPSASFNVNQCDTWMCPRFVHPYSLSWD